MLQSRYQNPNKTWGWVSSLRRNSDGYHQYKGDYGDKSQTPVTCSRHQPFNKNSWWGSTPSRNSDRNHEFKSDNYDRLQNSPKLKTNTKPQGTIHHGKESTVPIIESGSIWTYEKN